MRPLTLGLLAVIAVVVGQQLIGVANRPKLQTGPLVEQAIRVYRQGGDSERLGAIREQLDGLRPAEAGYAELTACSEDGYLLRRIESAKAEVDYLDHPGVQGMGETARLVYLESMPQGVMDAMRSMRATWPSHYDCQKRDGALGWHMQDDREGRYLSEARMKMAKGWRADLEKEGPESFKLAEQRAKETLAVNHVIDDPETLARMRGDAMRAQVRR